jgi:hypothetical protein
VISEGGAGETRIYALIAVFIIIVVIFAVVFSNNQLNTAYIQHDFLGVNWCEDIGERDSGSQLLGLEKFSSLTYRIDGKYPAYLTIMTIKTLVMMSENELRDKTAESIEQTLEKGIVVDKATEVSGGRILKNEHNTMYVMYDGNDTSKNPPEKIKIIGEVWSCGTSGISIICIGIAQITDNLHDNSEVNISHWEKIVRDNVGTFGIAGFHGEDGLIYNVICH